MLSDLGLACYLVSTLHVQIRITQTLWSREEEFLCLIKLTFDSYGSSFEPESPSLDDKSCEHRNAGLRVLTFISYF